MFPSQSKTQRRFLQDSNLRDDSGTGTLVGYASVFNRETVLYEDSDVSYREVIRPGAFTRAIKEGQDVRALVNHDSNLMLGRTISGTLTLEEDGTGLLSRINPPDTQLGRDTYALVKRGDMSQMSFAFRASEGGYKRTIKRDREANRTVIFDEITDADLFDVSVVTYPAYQDARIEARKNVEDVISKLANARRDAARKIAASLIQIRLNQFHTK